jgi:DNA excision repair protein ERCC-2
MVSYGDIIADIREQHNLPPRSYLRSVGTFLLRWLDLGDTWVRIVERDDDTVRIEAYCLDASLASSVIGAFHASVHMSGTLQPLAEYGRSLGISTKTAAFPSPFTPEHRRIWYVPGVSTKYYMDDAMVEKIATYVQALCDHVGKNTLVLFPSYAIMYRFVNTLALLRTKYIELRGELQADLMRKLRAFKRKGGVFLSVMGGRLSEGIDFPSEQLELVIIVGIPYPPPSARQQALLRYYDAVHGNGWLHVMESHAVRKIMQSIGRLVRCETDRGAAVILDERARRFKRYMPLETAGDVVREVAAFFGQAP